MDYTPGTTDPATLNAKAEEALAKAHSPVPDPPAPLSDLVELPGGLVHDGTVIRTVIVRELTGEHEELLAKSSQARNATHFLSVLMECGVARVGDTEPKETRKLLKRLLLGDRDQVILGIRKATYGEKVDLPFWRCPECGELSDISFSLDDDVKTHTLDPVTGAEFEVPLRHDATARVRLATGEDQLAVWEPPNLTLAERNTLLLDRCVLSVKGPDGASSGKGARGMGMADRRAILTELTERQPGPRLDEVKILHDLCGKETPLGIGVGDLFRT
jgi:hypothetical protein